MNKIGPDTINIKLNIIRGSFAFDDLIVLKRYTNGNIENTPKSNKLAHPNIDSNIWLLVPAEKFIKAYIMGNNKSKIVIIKHDVFSMAR